MSVYPLALDSDETIIRIDDNITELGGEAINQLRDAIFSMQGELGTGLKGSLKTLADRLNVSLNTNGTIKQSALAAVGLVTLPIVDNQVASNAGIKEYKLALDHSTSDLYTLITSNKFLLDAVIAFASTTDTNFLNHLAGSVFLTDGVTSARHAASHIDLNSIPSDPRDPFFTWIGLKNKDGVLRTATQVADALFQINEDLTNHENAIVDAHIASAISVDTNNFQEIPSTANTVQKVIDYIERAEELNIGEHRAVQHSNGIPAVARSQSLTEVDGYGRDGVVPSTTVNAYLVNPPANTPVDSNTVGDDIIKFKPTNIDFVFDSQFSQVQIGDIVRINYGNGVAAAFEVESIRFVPGVEWIVRINGTNLANAVDGLVDGYSGTATARIDRPQFDYNTHGVLALASANSIPSTLYPNILGSVIVGNPKGATALGLGFDGNKLNSNHYKLWLQLYPTGNPADNVINLPFIDVTGDAGASPGSYTLEKVVHATNDAFRKVGYNFRFIAFEYKGDFGIMLADSINKASFSIVNGSNTTGTVVTDTYTQNVVGDASDGDGFDAFGFGSGAAGLAAPAYQSIWVDATAAQYPTKVITPAKRRFYIVDGRKLDTFAPTYLANADGYWPATITASVSTGSSIEVTYKVNLDLCAAKLKPGKTLIVQPTVSLSDAGYSVKDYGRFIIKQVDFSAPCGDVGAFTNITIINGVHADGNPTAVVSAPGLDVQIYFSEDSVGFNDLNIIDGGVTGVNYHRFHEIYVNRNGVTFSHERARMKSDQAEAAPPTSLLRSDFWHVKSVSPKLRGYRDGTTTFNKYVRFYVTRYDSASGEFDGYIGRRNSLNSNVSNIGPVTTSRKNVQTRFYDETYVDYIELEFKETAIGPTGTPILSDANARYVDIEIFPTMRLNDENMLIGSCEINWDPPTGENIVQAVKDLRDFGSVGPANFNTSAIDFMSAGDRLLHENGIVRGFQYVSSGAASTTGQLFFNGGVALVNGKVVTTNNSSVTIPAISDAGTLGVTVTWAVCVNEFGYLHPIILTTAKDQIFAAVGSLYYVPSITFDELVYDRKDLTLIAIVDAHIASITINDNDVHDFRRFIGNEGANHPLVLTQDEFVGNFHSFDAVKQWINKTSSNTNFVRVRGSWTIDATIDLTGYNSKVIFDADGAVFTVTSLKGFLLGSNVNLKNFKFIYSPSSITPDTGDIVVSGNGCLYGSSSVSNNLSGITIQNCQFTSDLSYVRSPYINIEINKGQFLYDSRFIDNTFSDSTTSKYNAAIAIVSLNDAISTQPAVVLNTIISGNTCDRNQGIIISVPSDAISRPGINILNTVISNNICGYIGYWSTSVTNTNTAQTNPSSGLIIKNNTCHYIETAMGNGQAFLAVASPYTWGFGSVVIEGNFCNWIHVCSQDGAASGSNTELSSMMIQANTLTAYDFTTWLKPVFTGDVSTNIAIIVQGFPTSAANDVTTAQILNNTINVGKYGATTYKYVSGIYMQVGGNIQGNIVKGFVKDGGGIVTTSLDGRGIIAMGSSGNATRNYTISQNQIYRGSDTVNAYISATSSGSLPSYGIVQDNFFDHPTIDGSSTAVTFGFPQTWLCQRNKNQTVTQVFHSRSGVWSVATVLVGKVASGNSNVTNSLTNPAITSYNYDNASNIENVAWKIPLVGNVPHGVTITGLEATVYITALSGTKQMVLTLNDPVGSDTEIYDLTTSPTLYQLTLSQNHIVYPTNNSSSVPEAIISFSTQHNSTLEINIDSFTIYYRW